MFDYYYREEADQFSFIRIPKQLFTDEKFKDLSVEAKLIYGLLLDRMSLSRKNDWIDQEGRVFIIFTAKQVSESISCGKNKAINTLKELDVETGIGLIEKKRLGMGKPNIIYVKNFTSVVKSLENSLKNVENNKKFKKQTSRSLKSKPQKFKNQTSRSLKDKLQEVYKINPNKTNTNKTDYSKTDMNKTNRNSSSIDQSTEENIKNSMRYLVGKWNSLPDPIQPVKFLDEDRENKIKALIEYVGLKGIDEAIDNISKSKFLMGRANGKGFVIHFDWFISLNNFKNVYEDKYIDHDNTEKTSKRLDYPISELARKRRLAKIGKSQDLFKNLEEKNKDVTPKVEDNISDLDDFNESSLDNLIEKMNRSY